jgi:hypothetical protein
VRHCLSIDFVRSKPSCIFVRRPLLLCSLLLNLFVADRFRSSARRAFRWSTLSINLFVADFSRW